jgi:hypothetical protein
VLHIIKEEFAKEGLEPLLVLSWTKINSTVPMSSLPVCKIYVCVICGVESRGWFQGMGWGRGGSTVQNETVDSVGREQTGIHTEAPKTTTPSKDFTGSARQIYGSILLQTV